MRTFLLVVGILLLAVSPMTAQNTDIESLSGLQFNFGNPGARSLGMGGAFIGLADDASAAEANPAGLTILRKPEISIEARNYLEQQLLTTSGTYPELERTAFTHYSDRVQLAFASIVYPIKNQFTLGVYFHEPLRNSGAGQVVPRRNEFSGRIEADVPNFFLPRGGEPVSEAECAEIRRRMNDFLACLEYTVNPFISALDVRQQTYGLTGAWQVLPKFSVGASLRMQTFKESSFTFRVDPEFNPLSISVQATAGINEDGEVEVGVERDFTVGLGFKWTPHEKVSVGGVYKQGPQFTAPTFYAGEQTGGEFVVLADTQFHIPDIAGVGVSYSPIPVLRINFDAVHVTYSNLVDDFVSSSETVRALPGKAYEAKDVTELRLGAEYFFTGPLNFALRAGYWRDPAHALKYIGPVNHPELVAEAILYPGGEDQDHFTVGAGLAFQRFSIDAAYDTSEHYKVGSISLVVRR